MTVSRFFLEVIQLLVTNRHYCSFKCNFSSGQYHGLVWSSFLRMSLLDFQRHLSVHMEIIGFQG